MKPNILVSKYESNIADISAGVVVQDPFQVLHDELLVRLSESANVTDGIRNDESIKHALERISPERIENLGGAVFMGPPDPVSLNQFYLMADAAQTGLPPAYLNPNDPMDTRLKPIVIFEPDPADHAWKIVEDRMQFQHDTGLAKANIFETGIVRVVHNVDDAIEALNSPIDKPRFDPTKTSNPPAEYAPGLEATGENPRIFVCCSFSTKNPLHSAMAEELGAALANNSFDIVTGGGRSMYRDGVDYGMMFHVQKGAAEAHEAGAPGGHVVGVTFPNLNPIAEHEGERTKRYHIHQIERQADMTSRITAFGKHNQALFIDTGGLGTDTEAFAPAYNEQKPIIIRNIPVTSFDEEGRVVDPNKGDPNAPRMHDGIIKMLEKVFGYEEGKDFFVLNHDLKYKGDTNEVDVEATAKASAQAAVETVAEVLANAPRRQSGSASPGM